MKHHRHVHISLVGGEPTPVYQGVVYTQPDMVILICSDITRPIAENIKQQLPSLGEDVMIYTISDSNLPEMFREAREIAALLPSSLTVSLNLSSGLKVWTLVFNNTIRDAFPDAIIFCLNQDGTVFNLLSGQSNEKVDFDMDTQFRLLGHELAGYTPFSDYTAEDMEVLRLVKYWGFAKQHHYAFKALTDEFFKRSKDLGTTFSEVVRVDGNELQWLPDEERFVGKLNDVVINLHSPHVWHIVLNTGWFEVYVASLLALHFPAVNIRLNCLFKTRTNAAKNEVDIIVNTGKKLIFVECKTQVFDTTMIDKFASVVRTYGGLGSKALFVTNSPMKAEAKEKCEDKYITTYYTARKDVSTPEERTAHMGAMLKSLVEGWNAK